MPKKFDELQQAILKQIKKDNPNLSDEEAEQKSFAVATTQWKKSHGGKGPAESLTEDGKIIVAENVKLILNSSITAVDTIQE